MKRSAPSSIFVSISESSTSCRLLSENAAPRQVGIFKAVASFENGSTRELPGGKSATAHRGSGLQTGMAIVRAQICLIQPGCTPTSRAKTLPSPSQECRSHCLFQDQAVCFPTKDRHGQTVSRACEE
jgi:hypothetical protein